MLWNPRYSENGNLPATRILTDYQLTIGSFLPAITFMWSDRQIPGWPRFFQQQIFPSVPSLVDFNSAIISRSFHLDFLCASLAASITSCSLLSNFRNMFVFLGSLFSFVSNIYLSCNGMPPWIFSHSNTDASPFSPLSSARQFCLYIASYRQFQQFHVGFGRRFVKKFHAMDRNSWGTVGKYCSSTASRTASSRRIYFYRFKIPSMTERLKYYDVYPVTFCGL